MAVASAGTHRQHGVGHQHHGLGPAHGLLGVDEPGWLLRPDLRVKSPRLVPSGPRWSRSASNDGLAWLIGYLDRRERAKDDTKPMTDARPWPATDRARGPAQSVGGTRVDHERHAHATVEDVVHLVGGPPRPSRWISVKTERPRSTPGDPATRPRALGQAARQVPHDAAAGDVGAKACSASPSAARTRRARRACR